MSLVQILTSTLSSDSTIRRNAEKELLILQSSIEFGSAILNLTQDINQNKSIRQSAALNFKNWIKSNWGVSYLYVISSHSRR